MFAVSALLLFALHIAGFNVFHLIHLNGFGHSVLQLKIVGITVLQGVYPAYVYAGLVLAVIFYIFCVCSDVFNFFNLFKRAS